VDAAKKGSIQIAGAMCSVANGVVTFIAGIVVHKTNTNFSGRIRKMKKSTKGFAILVFLVSVLGVFAQDKTPPEAYSGAAMGTGGSVGGKSIQFDFRITRYTTDQEVENFAQLVKEKGCASPQF
jgi:hypothetical protein